MVRRTKRLGTAGWLVAGALGALAAWPVAVHGLAARAEVLPDAGPTPAPVKADYSGRDETIAFLESRLGRDPADALIPRMLSAQYLQRFRERGDVGDVLRAEHDARRSLAVLPRGNAAGDVALASALTALHRFREADAAITDALRSDPANPGLRLQHAAIALELGDYARARAELAAGRDAPAALVVASREAEETGSVAAARASLEQAMHLADAIYDTPAERRAWFHFRDGELAFLTGDDGAAIDAERAAIAIFPDDAPAWNALARMLGAEHRWSQARDAATRCVALVPSPETLGYLADAQAALGDPAAAITRDEIVAVERIGNAQHLSDRLLAMYYADHGIRSADAYAIARREVGLRDDVYAEDTLAWTAARAGRWTIARAAAVKAMRFDTQDPRMQYHAGVIALQAGARDDARRRFARALQLNPHFHSVEAGLAREELVRLGGSSTK